MIIRNVSGMVRENILSRWFRSAKVNDSESDEYDKLEDDY
jgi:hypothetical protein